jgi:5'/3'-nucleotidase SurE
MRAARDRRLIPGRAAGVAIAVGSLAAAPLPRLAAAEPAALCSSGPLEILLTNDDGYQSIGIRALRTQLKAAGHHVTLAAPDHNASGSAMSFSWGPVRVTPDPTEPDVFAVAATPATSVVLATTVLYTDGRRPDLVISGINHGSNAGSLLALSGTIGAALAGTLLLDPPVPGLAVNAMRRRPDEAVDSPANRAQFDAVAEHFTRLLASVRGWYCDGDAVTRSRTVLNVNYPARAVTELRGTVVAGQGSSTDLRVTFKPTAEGQFQAHTLERATSDARESDNQRLEQGYVTVTPLNGRLGDDSASSRRLERRLRGL